MRTGVLLPLLAFAGCFESLDGFTGGVVPGPDGGIDASAEAALPADSGTDAQVDAGPRFCADKALAVLCADFDEPDALTTFNGNQRLSPGAALAVEGGSLHATLPAQDDDGQFFAALDRSFQTSLRILHMDVDVFVTTPAWPTPAGNASFLSIGLDGPPYIDELYLNQGLTSVTTTTGSGNYSFSNVSVDIPYDRWVHVSFSGNFNPGAGSFYLAFDGVKVDERKDLVFTEVGDALNVRLGIIRPNRPTPAFDVRYDNLLVTME